jgi:cellulose synthase/poly-beta-1,6-N-acetylglucosamine synthase-like glycosyltransferase
LSAQGARNRRAVVQERLRLSVVTRLGRPDKSEILRRATFGLAEERPHFSARRVVTRWQAMVLLTSLAAVLTAFVIRPLATADIVVAAMALGFICSFALRGALALLGRSPKPDLVVGNDQTLPVYSILVPVYREAEMIGELSRALAALDYPSDKLDIRLVVEEDDRETCDAVFASGLNTVVVPPGFPRTKPKACNFALQYARGEFVVVYDAEDRPEPDQLQKAVAAFRANPDVSCLQARLAIDRAPSWISRMFAIDYAVWFRTLLPGLARLNAPIPLGGTSNHFRVKTLVEAGAWDPFNVTEDADLGVRLARLGHRVAILDSATFEEAPKKLGTWLRQRTRWMKGYMQTMLVHSRNPKAAAAEIGVGGGLLIASFLGGAVWSALVNPVMWIVCIAAAILAPDGGGTLALLARISGFALFATNVLLAALAAIGGERRGAEAAIVLIYPLYWLLISAATYRALWQLLRNPFHWEKTPHGAGR